MAKFDSEVFDAAGGAIRAHNLLEKELGFEGLVLGDEDKPR